MGISPLWASAHHQGGQMPTRWADAHMPGGQMPINVGKYPQWANAHFLGGQMPIYVGKCPRLLTLTLTLTLTLNPNPNPKLGSLTISLGGFAHPCPEASCGARLRSMVTLLSVNKLRGGKLLPTKFHFRGGQPMVSRFI